jgi:hypothetical protein
MDGQEHQAERLEISRFSYIGLKAIQKQIIKPNLQRRIISFL